MEPRPPADGDPGTPPHAGGPQQPPPDQPPYPQQPPQGQPPYQGQPYQGQQYQGQQYQGQQYGGPPQHPGMPPIQGMPYGQQPGGPRKTSVPAILSLIFACVGAILVSVILAIVALSRIPSRNQKGKGLAIAGLVVSGLWLVGIVVALALSDGGEPDRDASGQVTATQNTRPDKLRVGDCVSEIKEGEVANIKVVPCDQPNGGKVFAVFDLPAGDWPGLTAVQTAAEKGCTDRWEASKQKAEQPSSIFYLHPTEDGWQLGDRGATCLLTPK
jgi:hypothetical protein